MMSNHTPARRPAAPRSLAGRAADAPPPRTPQVRPPPPKKISPRPLPPPPPPGAPPPPPPLSRRAGRGCAAPAQAPGRRPAPLLRHQRLPDVPQPRPPHGRRGLPDLRLRSPAGLTRAAPGRHDGGHRAGAATVDGPWITRRRAPKLVDRPPCGCRPRQAMIRSARRGRDERTAVPPQGGRAPRKGSRILRKEGRPFRKGGARFNGCTGAARCRTRSQEREELRKERHSCPQGWRVPRKGGEATESAVLSGVLLRPLPGDRARHPSHVECRLDRDVSARHPARPFPTSRSPCPTRLRLRQQRPPRPRLRLPRPRSAWPACASPFPSTGTPSRCSGESTSRSGAAPSSPS